MKLVRQEGIKDCGVACLQMILLHYGSYETLEYLRRITKTTNEGTTAFNLLNGAKKLGFKTKAVECEMHHLQIARLPVIAHVTIDKTFDHFIVIERIDKKGTIYVKDPARGNYKLTSTEFEEIWNKILLLFYPKNVLKKAKEKHFKLTSLISPYKRIMFKIFVLSLLHIVLNFCTSFYLKLIIDTILPKKNYYFLSLLTFVISLFYLLKLIINYVKNNLVIKLNLQITQKLTSDAVKQIISLPYQYYKNKNIGDIMMRIKDVDEVKQLLSQIIFEVSINLFVMLITFMILLVVNQKVTLIILSFCLLYIISSIFFLKKNSICINNVKEKEGIFSSFLVEAIAGYETIKGQKLHRQIIRKNEKNYDNLQHEIKKFETKLNRQNCGQDFINSLVIIILNFLGCLEVLQNKMSIGDLILYNSLVLTFLESVQNIISVQTKIFSSNVSLKRLNELFGVVKEDVNNSVNEIKGDILIKDLSYSYNGYSNLLSDINLDIPFGSKVMIYGKSGSGKSTFLKLLMKYYEDIEGEIFIDKNSYDDLGINFIRNSFSYIAQNETLFTGTILDNITMERDISDEKLRQICDICDVTSIVENKRNSFYHMIEENGFNLSGGEKQRIILARALVRDFNFLLIDEATSQLDLYKERKILIELFKAYSDKTIIFITHRHVNLDLFDQIIEIENGLIKNV